MAPKRNQVGVVEIDLTGVVDLESTPAIALQGTEEREKAAAPKRERGIKGRKDQGRHKKHDGQASRHDLVNANSSFVAAAGSVPDSALANSSFVSAFHIEDDGLMQEANDMGTLRLIMRSEQPSVEGYCFNKSVWEFYMVKGAFSDKMCVGAGKAYMYFALFCPMGWPLRLCKTMSRAAPVYMRFCRCCGCNMRTRSCPLVLGIFLLPCIAILTFFDPFNAALRLQYERLLPNEKDRAPLMVIQTTIFMVSWAAFMLLFWWARLLLTVSLKYHIWEAVDRPFCFMLRTMCCICAKSQQIGLHVDRAQGFMEIEKRDRSMVKMSSDVTKAPSQASMDSANDKRGRSCHELV